MALVISPFTHIGHGTVVDKDADTMFFVGSINLSMVNAIDLLEMLDNLKFNESLHN
jgi:hypothetical protein